MRDSIVVRLEIKNQKAREDLKHVISTVTGCSIQPPEDTKPCDLLILEITANNFSKEFEYINYVQTSGASKTIFLTSSLVDPSILIQALKTGAKEFFTQPINGDEVSKALLKLKEQQLYPDTASSKVKCKHGTIIDVFGSKGGVGTTTVAVNLANSLVELDNDKSVALIDMNRLFGEIPLFLDLSPAFNWSEVSNNIARLDAMYLMSILTKHPSGLYILPAPPSVDGSNPTTAQIIENILRLMQSMFDFIVIDSGQSLDETSMQIFKQSHKIVLVSVLSLPCLINLKRLLNTFQQLGYPPLDMVKVIVNRYHKKSFISLKEAEKSIKKRIFWSIPNDYNATMTAINQGKPLSVIEHKTDISESIRELASALLEKDYSKKKKEKEKSSFLSLKFNF